MIALQVQVNNDQPIIAGGSDLGGLNAGISAVGTLGKESKGAVYVKDKVNIDIFVGGLTQHREKLNEHLRWIKHQKLKCGDEIVIKIIETDQADEPMSREIEDVEKTKKIREEFLKKYGKGISNAREE
ncbi:MAG: hypothetical protein AB7S78_09800 [Candidatus Omnitrophota bacterium]